MTTGFLFITQIVLVVVLTIAVLLQKSSSIGLGAYSGSNESMFGAKGPAGFLAKATLTIGFLFVINTITLGYMYSKATQASVVDKIVVDSRDSSYPRIENAKVCISNQPYKK